MTIIIKKSMDKAGLQKLLGELSVPKRFDAYKYCGLIHLDRPPLEIQKQLRDEWG